MTMKSPLNKSAKRNKSVWRFPARPVRWACLHTEVRHSGEQAFNLSKKNYSMKKNRFGWIAAWAFMLISYQTYSQAAFPTVTVNLSYPQFQRLKLEGGYVYIEGAGLRGIILY